MTTTTEEKNYWINCVTNLRQKKKDLSRKREDLIKNKYEINLITKKKK